MKIIFKYDDGTELATTAENLIINQGTSGPHKDPTAIIGSKIGNSVVPLLPFPGFFFTPEGMQAHDAQVSNAMLETIKKAEKAAAEDAAKAAAAAEAAKKPAASAPQQVLPPATADEKTYHGGSSDPMGD